MGVLLRTMETVASLIRIWIVRLLGIGLAEVGGALRGRAAVVVLVTWGVFILCVSGAAALF